MFSMQNLITIFSILFFIGWNIIKCIDNDVLFCKYAKLNVLLICVHKPKTTN